MAKFIAPVDGAYLIPGYGLVDLNAGDTWEGVMAAEFTQAYIEYFPAKVKTLYEYFTGR